MWKLCCLKKNYGCGYFMYHAYVVVSKCQASAKSYAQARPCNGLNLQEVLFSLFMIFFVFLVPTNWNSDLFKFWQELSSLRLK